MADIPFTQFLMPDGRPSAVTIERPTEISTKAHALIALGFRFECEMLPTREVSFTITNDDGDHAIEVCNNGPDVLVVIDRMISNFDAAKVSRAA